MPIGKATPAQIDSALGALSQCPDLASRIDEISARFLGEPYVQDPLGEGKPPDADPTIDLRHVDCVTFVEETIALALSKRYADARALLQRIRYQGSEIEFTERNHFTEAQWLPQNLRKGFLADVTRAVSGAKTRSTTMRFDDATWRRFPAWRKKLGANAPRGTFEMDYVPANVAWRLADRFPNGSVVVVLRAPRRSAPTRISHMGLIVWKAKHPFVRHASRRHGKVLDVALRPWLRSLETYAKIGKRWAVDGVSVYQITAPPQVIP